MIRQASAIAIALCLNSSSLCAQTATAVPVERFTVGTASAGVYKFPTTASPLLGQAPRGTVLEVTRELGSWVKVAWPGGEDGAAYVHVSSGSIGRGIPPTQGSTAATTSSAATTESISAGAATPGDTPRTLQPASRQQTTQATHATQTTTYVAPPSHTLGFGARFDVSHSGFGGSARAWSKRHVGIQFDVSRETLSDDSGDFSSLQFAPSVIGSFGEHVGDYVSLRPYLGAGPSFFHQSLTPVALTAEGASSESSFGIQAFGGGEFTFASLPQVALGLELGYRGVQTSFAGFDINGFVFAASVHWYVH